MQLDDTGAATSVLTHDYGARDREVMIPFPIGTLGDVLSRDSPLGQRKRPAFAVQCIDGLMDGAVECVGIGEGLMREMVRLEVA
ncbi:MAG TPA: hypothetical protein VK726_08740, partial [Acetobacteraceae bacterium]|nr:hypothetical protein [Acetobacteraceae bacterium]